MPKPASPAIQAGDSLSTGLVAAYPLINSVADLVASAGLAVFNGHNFVAGAEGQQLNFTSATSYFDCEEPWVADLGASGASSEGMAFAIWMDISTAGFRFQIDGDSGGTNPVNHLLFCTEELAYFAPGSAIHGWTGVEFPEPYTGSGIFVCNVNGLDVDFYFDGVLMGSLTLSGGTGSHGMRFRCTGYNGVQNGGADTDIVGIYAWNRPLTAAELGRLDSDFWAHITPSGGGGGTDYPASIAGSIAFAGVLGAALRARGALPGSIAASAGLHATQQAQASAAGSVAASGDLRGAQQAQGRTTGAVSISGTAHGAQDSGGAVSGTVGLAGSLDGAAHQGAMLSGSLGVGGALRALGRAAASVVGAVVTGGDFRAATSGVHLGRLLGSFSVSGDFRARQSSTGQVAGGVDVSGSLRGFRSMPARLAGALNLSGALRGTQDGASRIAGAVGVGGAARALGRVGASLSGALSVLGSFRSVDPSAPAVSPAPTEITLEAEGGEIALEAEGGEIWL